MTGGLPPPKIVVVHRRQIVVDEAHGVYHLQRHGRGHRRLLSSPEHLARRDAQYRAYAFPPRHEGVRHRLAYAIGLGDARQDGRG